MNTPTATDIRRCVDAVRNKHPLKAIPKFMKDKAGNLFQMASIHESWHNHIDKHKFSLIISPRDHGKSEQIAIGKLLCEIGKDPSIRSKLFSGNQAVANKRVTSIKRYITNSEEYQTIYPNIVPAKEGPWTSSSIKVESKNTSKEPTLEAYGIKATYTGDRADLIVCDDICTFENTIGKPAEREVVKDKFYNDIMNLLEPDGRLIYICTLWHQDDLSHELMRNRNENGFALLFQAYNETLSELLWPEKWTRKALEERRSKNVIAFDRGFRNIPISEEDALFKRDWISNCIRVASKESIPELIKQIIDPTWIIYTGVDLAISKKETADYTVIFVMAYDLQSHVKIPLEIFRGRFTSPETAKMIMMVNSKWHPSLFMVENNAYQESLLQWIEELPSWELGWSAPTVEGVFTGKQKFDEFVGLPSMASEFHNKSWILYNHTNPLETSAGSCKCSFCTFIDELVTFPIGKHDDTIMAAWFAREAARKDSMGGFEIW